MYCDNSIKKLAAEEKKTSDSDDAKQHKVIDLRSDTVSRPTMGMRRAMLEAEVGDDVYGEDPTANRLERRVAELFQKDAAIFLPTGTMGNVIAVLGHCDRSGREIIVGDQSHIFQFEQGAPAQLGGIHTRTIPNLPNGTFDLTLLENSIRGDDIHLPVTGLVAVENTHNMCGGKVLPMEWLKKLTTLTKRYGIPVHMDGARIFNASKYLGISVAEITKDVDSVQFCFSKGLGAPIGSMLVGSVELIRRARRLRKVLGAGMRQVGVIAAPCAVALDTMVDRLELDHKRAAEIAKGIAECNSDLLRVDLENLHTNILMVYLKPDVFSSSDFCSRLSKVTKEEEKSMGADNTCVVRIFPRNNAMARFVLYWEITDDDVQRVVKKLVYIAQELKA